MRRNLCASLQSHFQRVVQQPKPAAFSKFEGTIRKRNTANAVWSQSSTWLLRAAPVDSALCTRSLQKDCHLMSHYKWDPTANECTFRAKVKEKSIVFAHFLLDERPLCDCEKFRSCPSQKQRTMPIAHLCEAEHWCWDSNFGVKQHTLPNCCTKRIVLGGTRHCFVSCLVLTHYCANSSHHALRKETCVAFLSLLFSGSRHGYRLPF